MNEFLIEILAIIQPLALTLIESAGAVLIPLMMWKLNEWGKAKVHDSRFHCAMDKITTHAEAAVMDVMQTYVKGVRKSGKWNGAAAREAKEMGRERMKQMLGPAGLKELKGCLGQDQAGVDGIIDGAMERAVVMLRDRGLMPKGGHAPDGVDENDGADPGGPDVVGPNDPSTDAATTDAG